jgi:hypothetical protein
LTLAFSVESSTDEDVEEMLDSTKRKVRVEQALWRSMAQG